MTLRRDQKYMSYYGGNPGNTSANRMRRWKYSTGDTAHPYMKASFWANPSNHFWENRRGLYSQETIEYYRSKLSE